MGVWSSPHQAFIDECLKEEEEMAEVDFVKTEVQAEIVPSNGAGLPVVTATPQGAIELAIRQNVPVETLVKLFELKERAEASEARKAFDKAFAAFQAEAPALERTKEVSFGQGKTAYKYTPLDEAIKQYRPVLAKHGLSFKWSQTQSADGKISVTCILKHTQGHFDTNTLEGPADSSGSKNPIQSISSGVSYLRRYTFLGVTGGATGDEDTDGMTMGECADFLALIKESRTLDELVKNYKDAVADALKRQSPKAIGIYMEARKKREAELRA